MGKIPIALQLYSIRKDAEADLASVLKAVAQMGYDGVEFAGYCGWSAADLKKMVADNGLKVAGAHVGLDTLLGDQLKESIDFHRAIGNQFLIGGVDVVSERIEQILHADGTLPERPETDEPETDEPDDADGEA